MFPRRPQPEPSMIFQVEDVDENPRRAVSDVRLEYMAELDAYVRDMDAQQRPYDERMTPRLWAQLQKYRQRQSREAQRVVDERVRQQVAIERALPSVRTMGVDRTVLDTEAESDALTQLTIERQRRRRAEEPRSAALAYVDELIAAERDMQLDHQLAVVGDDDSSSSSDEPLKHIVRVSQTRAHREARRAKSLQRDLQNLSPVKFGGPPSSFVQESRDRAAALEDFKMRKRAHVRGQKFMDVTGSDDEPEPVAKPRRVIIDNDDDDDVVVVQGSRAGPIVLNQDCGCSASKKREWW